jgi:hypothetical protein
MGVLESLLHSMSGRIGADGCALLSFERKRSKPWQIPSDPVAMGQNSTEHICQPQATREVT